MRMGGYNIQLRKTFLGDKRDYYRSTLLRRLFIVMCLVVAFISFGVALTIGKFEISALDCYRVIWEHLTDNIQDPRVDNIIWGTRVPVALYAILCGAVLSIGGAVMQSILRNPLADPYMMGISSGASLGVSLCVIMGLSVIPGLAGSLSQVAMAFIFSLIPMAVILLFSLKRRVTPTKIILIGVAVAYVFSALTTILMITADEESLADVYRWNVGSFALIGWEDIPIPFAFSIVGFVVLMSMHRKINVMMAGTNTAHSLGIDTHRTTIILMLVVSLMTAAVVSFCGTVGFIGLVGPHIARIFVGSESKYLLPASAAFGAAFLLIANSIASVAGSSGLPVGVVSAIIGCPVFLLVLIRMKKSAWS